MTRFAQASVHAAGNGKTDDMQGLPNDCSSSPGNADIEGVASGKQKEILVSTSSIEIPAIEKGSCEAADDGISNNENERSPGAAIALARMSPVRERTQAAPQLHSAMKLSNQNFYLPENGITLTCPADEDASKADTVKGAVSHCKPVGTASLHQSSAEDAPEKLQLSGKQTLNGLGSLPIQHSSQEPVSKHQQYQPPQRVHGCGTADLPAQNECAIAPMTGPSLRDKATPQIEDILPSKNAAKHSHSPRLVLGKSVGKWSCKGSAQARRPTKVGSLQLWPTLVADEQQAILEVLIADASRLQSTGEVLLAH
jgi:hypothetical protein